MTKQPTPIHCEDVPGIGRFFTLSGDGGSGTSNNSSSTLLVLFDDGVRLILPCGGGETQVATVRTAHDSPTEMYISVKAHRGYMKHLVYALEYRAWLAAENPPPQSTPQQPAKIMSPAVLTPTNCNINFGSTAETAEGIDKGKSNSTVGGITLSAETVRHNVIENHLAALTTHWHSSK